MPVIPLLLTLVSSILYACSFPPLSAAPLAWFALAPFFVACATVSPGCAAGLGLLWGGLATYGVAWWLPSMVTDYLNVSSWSGWVGFFFVAIGLVGVYVAGFAAWLSWMTRTRRIPPFLTAAAWGSGEFARANVWIGNPWGLLGYSQVPFPWVMQIADVAGPYGVGILVATVNGSLAGLCQPKIKGKHSALSSLIVLFILGAVLAYGKWRLSQTFTTGESLPIAIVQGAIERAVRWSPKHTKANLERYLTLSQANSLPPPVIVFWPEYAVNFYLQVDSPLTDSVLRLSRDLKADLILGGPHFSYGLTTMLRHNSVFLVREGKLTSRYDKVQLVPLAEENRFGSLFADFPSTYEAGMHFHSLRTKVAGLGVFICFEALFPQLVQKTVAAGAELLANPSNDDWFGHSAAARQHLAIASVRAIENRRYLVRATTNGFSAVVDPYGRITAISNFGKPEVMAASVQRSQARTPYQQWGDAVSWGAVGLIVLVSLVRIGVALNQKRRNTI